MKKILILLCTVISITSCNAQGSVNATRGNKSITSIEKSITPYSELSVAGACSIVYEQKANKSPFVRIEIDENLKEYVNAEVKNGVLFISLEGRNLQPTQFKAYTNSASLSKVRIAGSGDVTLKGKIKSPSLDISIAGSGNVYADDLQDDNLNISVSGSGNVKVAGNAINNKISVSGSGNVDATNLKAQNTACSISGSGNAKVYASQTLAAKVSGSGNLRYKGEPKNIDKKVSGSGTISKL